MGHWVDSGFVANTIDDYKGDLRTLFTNAFGADFNVTDETLPQNILIQELAELFANADAASIEVLTRLNTNTASGIWLDFIALARGLKRYSGTPQTATVSVVSNPSSLPFTIGQGQIFTCNETGDTFKLNAAATINSANTSIQVSYEGEGNSSAVVGNHLRTDGAPGIISMEIVGLGNGKERETDAEFRARLSLSAPVFNPTIEHIENEIKALPDIRGIGVTYNDTATTDTEGLPPYTTEFLVAPSADIDRSTEQFTFWKESVGKAILWNKVPGSPTYGNTTVNIADPFGTMKNVSFSVPDEIPLAITINIKVNEEVGAPDLQEIDTIKTNIADYVNSLAVGIDVAYSKVMQEFLNVSSMDIVSVVFKNLKTGKKYTNQNYVIETRQYASCKPENIEVKY